MEIQATRSITGLDLLHFRVSSVLNSAKGSLLKKLLASARCYDTLNTGSSGMTYYFTASGCMSERIRDRPMPLREFVSAGGELIIHGAAHLKNFPTTQDN